MSAQPETGPEDRTDEDPGGPRALTGAEAETGHDVVVVGVRAGGAAALDVLLRDLPPDLPAAVLVVRTGSGHDVGDLDCALPVRDAVDGAPLEAGAVVVGPPGRHLLLVEGRTLLAAGPAEDGHRPAVDALLRSAALDAGGRLVGVLLTGSRTDGDTDGEAGLRAVLRHGGQAVVAGAVPSDAVERGAQPVAPDALADVVVGLVRAPAPQTGPAGPEERARDEVEVAASRGRAAVAPYGVPTSWTCPVCPAGLLLLHEGRFRCGSGHAWSLPGLQRAQDAEVERRLRAALAAVEQQQAIEPGRPAAAAHAAVLRRLLADGAGPVGLP